MKVNREIIKTMISRQEKVYIQDYLIDEPEEISDSKKQSLNKLIKDFEIVTLAMYGFRLSNELQKALFNVGTIEEKTLKEIMATISSALYFYTGASPKMEFPLFKNFKIGQLERKTDIASDKRFLNTMLKNIPTQVKDRDKLVKEYEEIVMTFDNTEKSKILKLATDDDVLNLFKMYLASTIPLNKPEQDFILETLFVFDDDEILESDAIPEIITIKETMVVIVGEIYSTPQKQKYKISSKRDDIETILKRTSFDIPSILKLAKYLSFGENVSSEKIVKFNLNSAQRKLILTLINNVGDVQKIVMDIYPKREEWKKILHLLHIGSYETKYPVAAKASHIIRNEYKKIDTFYAVLQKHIKSKSAKRVAKLLSTRPGEFYRRLDYVVREFQNSDDIDIILEEFKKTASKLNTPQLLQLKYHFNGRFEQATERLFRIPGVENKYYFKSKEQQDKMPAAINPDIINNIHSLIDGILKERFSKQNKIHGRIFIDSSFKNIVAPMSFKGLVTGYEVYAPGTRLKFSEKDDYIRLFLSWKYKSDIDLSIGFVSESPEKEGYMDFNEKSMSVNYVSYRKLSLKYAAHSGDYTNGSDGAVEYIDINRKDVIKDYRFGIVVVNVFRGGSFENQNAIAGIQISSKDSFQKTATSSKQLGPVGCKFFDPTKTKLKLDLFGNYNYNVPMIIDFKKGEIIVCNLGNSLPEASYLSKESASTLAKYISPIFSYNKTKPNLYDLIMLHAVANGCEVDTEYNPETQYDYIFSNEIEQAVKAYDIEFFVENLMS